MKAIATLFLLLSGCSKWMPEHLPQKTTLGEDGQIHVGMEVDFKGMWMDYSISIHPREAQSYGSIAVDFFDRDGTFWQRETLLRDGALFSPMEIIGAYAGLVLFTKSGGSGGYGNLQYLEYGEENIYPATQIPEPTAQQLENTRGRDWAWLENNRLFRRWPIYKDTDFNCCPSGGWVTLEYLWDERNWVPA